MKNRRDFIKNTALLAGAIGFSKLSFAENLQTISHNQDDSEDFWKLVRSQFPLSLSKTFLNNGTIGPSPYPVLNAVQNEMNNIECNAIYGGYEKEALDALARVLHCKADEISLTKNVTEGINLACWGLDLKKGDEVILSHHEHVGNAGPWLSRVHHTGIVLKTIPLGKTAEETLEIVKKACTSKTKAIALPHIPCTIGQVLPIKAICRFAKEKGIFTAIDGAHPLGMLNLNLKDLGCDLYSGCCHKWLLGPKGTGYLYVSESVRENIKAWHGGAGVDTGWELVKEIKINGYVDTGHKFYYGTHNAALYKGIAAAVEFQEAIGIEKIEKRILGLATYLQDHLLKLSDKIEMQTPTESVSRAALVAFKIKDKQMSDLHKILNEKQIVTRYVPENDINCLRVSTHIYNNYKQIDTLLEQVAQFIQ
jgi:selenocysteine lyase/cysteine desulfurase